MNKKVLLVTLISLLAVGMVSAIDMVEVRNALPTIGQSSWGTPLLIGFNKTLDLIEAGHTANGTHTSIALYGETTVENLTVEGDIDGRNLTTDGAKLDTITDIGSGLIITAAERTNLGLCYGWGDHSLVGYLTSYTETDSVFGAWDKATGITITESQISDLVHTVDTDTNLDKAGVEALTIDVTEAQITDLVHTVDTNTQLSSAEVKAAAVADAIVDDVTDVAASQEAVFEALALKEDAISGYTGTCLAATDLTVVNGIITACS